MQREVVWMGDSLDRVRTFPPKIRSEIGFNLDFVQNGQEPVDWKPMKTIGQGVREIRVDDGSGTYRVIYIVKVADKVHVLHAFQKKTQRTAKKDLSMAKRRLKEI